MQPRVALPILHAHVCRSCMHVGSKLCLPCPRRYVARINQNVVLKLGPRYDMGALLPRADQGWRMVASGIDYAVWEKVTV